MELNCPNCKTSLRNSDEICPICKYPIKGTDKEKSLFIGQQILKKDKVKLAVGHRAVTKYILLGLGLLNVLIVAIQWIIMNIDLSENSVLLIIGLTFIVLSFLAKERPIFSLIAGLTLYLLIHFIFYLKDPDNLFSGIGGKLMIIGMFIYGLYLNYEDRQIKKEHKNL